MNDTDSSPTTPPEEDEGNFELRLSKIGFCDLLATIVRDAEAPATFLEQEIQSEFEAGDYESRFEAMKSVCHFDLMVEWAKDNPERAAGLALTALYLRGGQFIAQEAVPVEPKEEEKPGG